MDCISCAMIAAAEAPPGGQGAEGLGGWVSLLAPFALIFVIFYLLVIRPQQKKERERQDMLKALKKNDRVVTAGGMLGTVVSVKEPWVVLRIDENNDVRARVLLGSITGKAPGAEAEEESKGEK